MSNRRVSFSLDVPDGWLSVNPRVVNEDGASAVLLRRAELDDPFTSSLVVSDRALGPMEHLAGAARAYRDGLEQRVGEVTVLQEAASGTGGYGQELRFRVRVNGSDVDVMQAQFLFEIPAKPAVQLVQLLCSAPVMTYPLVRAEIAPVLTSMHSEVSSTAMEVR